MSKASACDTPGESIADFDMQLIEADGRRYSWLRKQQGEIGEAFGALVAAAALAAGVDASIVEGGDIERIIDNAIVKECQ